MKDKLKKFWAPMTEEFTKKTNICQYRWRDGIYSC